MLSSVFGIIKLEVSEDYYVDLDEYQWNENETVQI